MIAAKPWSTDALLRLLLRLFVLLGVTTLAAAAAEQYWPGGEAEARRFWTSSATGLVFQLGGIALIAQFLRECRLSWAAAFGLERAGAGREMARGAALGLGVFVAALVLMLVSQTLMRAVHLEPQPQSAIEALQQNPDPARRLVVGLTAIGLAPVFEELVFRGLLLVALYQAGYPRLAFWGTAVFFGVTHLNLMTLLPLTFFAAVLNALYLRTGSLTGPITAHATFNTINFLWVVWGGPGA